MNKAQYQQYLKSEHWKKLRARKRRTGGKIGGKSCCGICASTEQIETHHLRYKNIYDVTTSDLRLLCRQCHETAHELMKSGLKMNSTSHHGLFSIIKAAVKKVRGFGNRNMFR